MAQVERYIMMMENNTYWRGVQKREPYCSFETAMAPHSSARTWRIPGAGSLVAAICGVAQSRTRLKRRSSSSSAALLVGM